MSWNYSYATVGAPPQPMPTMPMPIPMPMPMPTFDPVPNLLLEENLAVANALLFEQHGQDWIPNPNDPSSSYKPHYVQASGQWMKARQAALEIHMVTTGVISSNAQLRADAYGERKLKDDRIAAGQDLRPSPSFSWPPIYQADPGVIQFPPGTFQPPGEPPPEQPPPEPSGTETANQIGMLALLGGLIYVGYRIFVRKS